jgi:hypothetical protein
MNFMFNLVDYETCEVRLDKWWKDNPDGRVATELISFQNGQYIVQAYLYRTFADSVAYATGLAEEKITDRGVNSTSALENCETSAIARALANANYAAKGKRSSREEMTKVVKGQMATTKEYVPVEKEDDPWTIKNVPMPVTSEQAVATVKDIIGGTTDKDIPTCSHGKQRILRTGTSKQGKQWAAWDCTYKANVYQVGQEKACEPDRIWLELNSNGQWQPQKVRA